MSQNASQAAPSTMPVREEQFCTFYLGNLLFGVEVMCVQEVLMKQQMTRMPLAGSVVEGLINLRGQIVTAIDLRKRLGMPPMSDEQDQMNVVVRSGDSAFSLLVDEIGDVVDVDPETFEMPPSTLESAARELILGVYKLEGRLLMVLDTEQAVTWDEFNMEKI